MAVLCVFYARVCRLGLKAIGFAVLVTTAGAAWASSNLDKAREALDGRHYQQALNLAQRVDKEGDLGLSARIVKALALDGLGRRSDAIAELESALRDFPKDPAIYNNLAVIHARHGDLEQARLALEQGMGTDNEYSTLHQNLARVYQSMAQQAYQKALSEKGSVRPPHLAALTVPSVGAAQGRSIQQAQPSAPAATPAEVGSAPVQQGSPLLPPIADQGALSARLALDTGDSLNVKPDRGFVSKQDGGADKARSGDGSASVAEGRAAPGAPLRVVKLSPNAAGDGSAAPSHSRPQRDHVFAPEPPVLEGLVEVPVVRSARPDLPRSKTSIGRTDVGSNAPTAAIDPTTAIDPATGVKRRVLSWARAWSDQDVDGYLEHYSSRFDPPGSRSLSSWKSLRRSRLSRPKWIKVALSEVHVQKIDGKRATVTLLQHYRSDKLNSKVRKRLVLERSAQGWVILRETVLRKSR